MLDRTMRLLSNDKAKWYERAQVKYAISHEHTPIDLNLLDFLPELLPFKHHSVWEEVSEEDKSNQKFCCND